MDGIRFLWLGSTLCKLCPYSFQALLQLTGGVHAGPWWSPLTLRAAPSHPEGANTPHDPMRTSLAQANHFLCWKEKEENCSFYGRRERGRNTAPFTACASRDPISTFPWHSEDRILAPPASMAFARCIRNAAKISSLCQIPKLQLSGTGDGFEIGAEERGVSQFYFYVISKYLFTFINTCTLSI